jgi:hypothetical protein
MLIGHSFFEPVTPLVDNLRIGASKAVGYN